MGGSVQRFFDPAELCLNVQSENHQSVIVLKLSKSIDDKFKGSFEITVGREDQSEKHHSGRLISVQSQTSGAPILGGF